MVFPNEMWWLVLVLVVSLIKPKIIWDGPQIMSLMGYHGHIKWGENTHPLWEAPLLRQYCTKGRESMLGPSTHALIQYAVLYCGSNVLTTSSPCTLIPPQNGLLPGMVSQINPLFLKVFFFQWIYYSNRKSMQNRKSWLLSGSFCEHQEKHVR